MDSYSLQLSDPLKEEELSARLRELGGQFLYSTTSQSGGVELLCQASSAVVELLGKEFPLISAEPCVLPEIDWEAQWAAHGLGYRDGLLHLNMREYGDPIVEDVYMRPGPGFGDLSHPTTRLCLRLMASIVKGKTVLDIGSGSGVLSLAAAALGATEVRGIDIDPEAVAHARENAALAEWPCPLSFDLVGEEGSVDLILMNMIRSEQDLAWKDLAPMMISSGIRVEEPAAYQEFWRLRGWTILGRMDEDSWCAFLMQREAS